MPLLKRGLTSVEEVLKPASQIAGLDSGGNIFSDVPGCSDRTLSKYPGLLPVSFGS
jgi:hypothetical protein